MNLKLPQKQKMDKKAIVLYIVSICTCIIAALVVILSPYLGDGSLEDIISMGAFNTDTEEIEYNKKIKEFDNIFKNQLENHSDNIEVKKQEEDKDIIYTYYQNNDKKDGKYNLNLNIPYINIESRLVDKYNEEIKNTFEEKANNVIDTSNTNVIYSVQYQATIENDILSLIIYSNLKEASSAQRVIIQTYNYDLKNDSEITLEVALKNKNLNQEEVQKKINEEVSKEQQQKNDLKNLGYDIYQRNVEDEMYKIENTTEFFIKDNNIYIIYAYGNENLTSEKDLIIV